jgi:hypothetical protein
MSVARHRGRRPRPGQRHLICGAQNFVSSKPHACAPGARVPCNSLKPKRLPIETPDRPRGVSEASTKRGGGDAREVGRSEVMSRCDRTRYGISDGRDTNACLGVWEGLGPGAGPGGGGALEATTSALRVRRSSGVSLPAEVGQRAHPVRHPAGALGGRPAGRSVTGSTVLQRRREVV